MLFIWLNCMVDIQQYRDANECLLVESERDEFTLAGKLLVWLSDVTFL